MKRTHAEMPEPRYTERIVEHENSAVELETPSYDLDETLAPESDWTDLCYD